MKKQVKVRKYIWTGIRKIAPQKITHKKIAPYENPRYEYSPLWKFLLVKITPQNFAPEKIVPCEISPHEIPSPLTNHANESKNKNTKFFALKKAVQHNILIKITKVLFDTHMISQKYWA